MKPEFWSNPFIIPFIGDVYWIFHKRRHFNNGQKPITL